MKPSFLNNPTHTPLTRQKARPIGSRPLVIMPPKAPAKPTLTQRIQGELLTDSENVKDKRKYIKSKDVSVDAPDIVSHERRSLIARQEDAMAGLEEAVPTRLRISTISSKLIRKKAAVEITSPSEDPSVLQGVNSFAMGSPSVNKKCWTCGALKCSGHYGYIPLARPIIHPVFERVVYAILNCVCHCCGRPFHSLESAMKETQNVSAANSEWGYLTALEKASKDSFCTNPNPPPPMENVVYDCVSKKGRSVDIANSKGKNVVHFSDGRLYDAARIFKIFNNITPEWNRILGFNEDSHPRDLIITDLPVMPPIARPPVYENGVTKSNELTVKYSKIVVVNLKMGMKPEDAQHDKTMRNHIYELIIDDKKTKSKRMTTDKIVSIFLRIKGKEGLIRGASQGKRINYSARAVLSPATYLEFGQIGIPETIASTWGVPMTVTQANIGYIRELLLAGKILKHKAMSGPNKNIAVKVMPGVKELTLRQGDIVERWCQDGDLVIFNRQPTIHYGSIMGYTVVVINDRETVGVHPSATTPHNADFDGDAATIHLPLNPKTIAEVRDLMHITKNIIDRKTGKPMVGLIMDSITYAYILTDPYRALDKYTFLSILGKMKTQVDVNELQTRAMSYGLHPWSGRTLFSALFPSDFKYRKYDSNKKEWFIIEDGILISGRATSAHLGTGHRSLIQDLHTQYDADRTTRFITDATWLLIAFGDTFGFSIGLADCEYGRRGIEERELILAKIEGDIDALGPRPSDPILAKNFDDKIRTIVEQSRPLGDKLSKNYMSESCPLKGRQNAFGCMAKDIGGGGKSDIFNIAQVGGSIGQQVDKESRLPAMLSEGRRALPTQPKRPVGPGHPEAPVTERGYCVSSYKEGLSPDELYAILWGGRPGLIDTNLSTADVGAAQRLMSKAGENIILAEDGSIQSIKSVTNGVISGGYIYSFDFGGNGLDPSKMITVDVDGEGKIPSFCDLGDIIDKGNAMVGWVRKDVMEYTKKNIALLPAIEQKLKEEKERGLFDKPEYVVFDKPIRVTGGGYQRIEVPRDTNIIDLIEETKFPKPVPKTIVIDKFKKFSLQKVLVKTPIFNEEPPKAKPSKTDLAIPPISPAIIGVPKPVSGGPTLAPDEYLISQGDLSGVLEELM